MKIVEILVIMLIIGLHEFYNRRKNNKVIERTDKELLQAVYFVTVPFSDIPKVTLFTDHYLSEGYIISYGTVDGKPCVNIW